MTDQLSNPLINRISIALASDTGTSHKDRVTNNGTISVKGLVLGATWQYTLDGGVHWSDGTGESFELPEGIHHASQIQVKQTDASGNTSFAASLKGRVAIDVTAPTLSLALAADTGSDQNDNITGDATVIVTGLESRGPWQYNSTPWQYSLNGGSTWLNGSGNSFDLPAGAYPAGQVLARQTDTAGNISNVASLSALTIDDKGATLSLSLVTDSGNNPSDNITNDGTINVNGLDAAMPWQYSLDGGSTWSVGTGNSFELPDGHHTTDRIMARQIDAAGNIGRSSSLVSGITVDTMRPATTSLWLASDTGASSTDNITNDATVYVGGLESYIKWEYSLDGGTTWQPGFSKSIELLEGNYSAGQVLARQTDIAGNTSIPGSLPEAVSIILLPPPLALNLALDTGNNSTDGITSIGTVNVNGIKSGASWQYSLNGGSTWLNGSGAGFTLPSGTYYRGQVLARQTDSAGTSQTTELPEAVTVLPLPQAPVLALAADTGENAADGITNNGAVNISGLIPGADWQYSLDGGVNWLAGSGSSFGTSGEGEQNVLARQTDAASNTSPASALIFNLDTSDPQFSSASINGNILIISYNDANDLHSITAPVSAFTVNSDGITQSIASVMVDGSAKTITLTLDAPVSVAQVVTVAYDDPSVGDDENVVQDIAGNDAASTSGSTVTNNTMILENIINGTDADERLNGTVGIDVINGGNGADTIRAGAGVDKVNGGAGNDRIVIVGNLSGGGKIDSAEDTEVLGEPLTNYNGFDFNEDENGSSEIIDGGEGNDTLYVYGTADISHDNITGIEHVVIRSDTTFDGGFIQGLDSISGDGGSVIRIRANPGKTATINFNELGVTLKNIGAIDVGAGITVIIDNLDDLGGAHVLIGGGEIKASSGTLDLTGYTTTSELVVENEDGTPATGALKIDGEYIHANGSTTLITGTIKDDILEGTDLAETFDGLSGNDVFIGGAGDDRFVFEHAYLGNKTILDAAGVDTIDLSNRLGPANINLATGGSTSGLMITLGQGVDSSSRQPLDIYLLQDLSGSFGDDVAKVRTLLQGDSGLIKQVRDLQPNSNFGVGSFVDKPTSPFGSSGDYVYQNQSSIGRDENTFINAINNLIVKSGDDIYESQLEGLFQTALRAKSEIGFRDGALRIVLLTTDAPYHVAGDYSGVPANNGDAILDGSPAGVGEDYPTIEQVKQAVISANLYPVFAVTSNVVSYYENLVSQLGVGKVVALSSNSSNIVDVISTALKTVHRDFIENIIGTSESDTLVGNALNNKIEGKDGDHDILEGKGGNDTIIGGDGDSDEAVFSGSYSEYSITKEDGGWKVSDNIAERDGIDFLSDIEALSFNDKKIQLESHDVKYILENYDTSSSVSENYFKLFFDLSKASYFHTQTHSDYGAGDKDLENPKEFNPGPLAETERSTQDSYSKVTGFTNGYSVFNDFSLEGKNESYINAIGQKVKYSYILDSNGWYVASDDDYLISGLQRASSVAMLGESEDGKSLFITFRGSDALTDWIDDFADMTGHYNRFKPLFERLNNYINDPINHVEHVYVSGHSLGGQMATWYMEDNKGDDRFQAVVFEAANKARVGLQNSEYDSRIIAFEMENDLVPDIGAGNNPGKTIHMNIDGYPIPVTKHGMTGFQGAFLKSIPYLDYESVLQNTRIYSIYSNALTTDGGLGKSLLDSLMTGILITSSPLVASGELINAGIQYKVGEFKVFVKFVSNIGVSVIDDIKSDYVKFVSELLKGPDNLFKYIFKLAETEAPQALESAYHEYGKSLPTNILGEIPQLLKSALGVLLETWTETLNTGYNFIVADSDVSSANANLTIEQIPFLEYLGYSTNMTYRHKQPDINYVKLQPFFINDGVSNILSSIIPGVSFFNSLSGKIFDQKINIDASEWHSDTSDSLTVFGNFAGNKIIGSSSDDVLSGFSGDDSISGGLGNDILFGGDDKDVLNGGDNDDILFAGGDMDLLIGGDGVDILYSASYSIAKDDKGFLDYLDSIDKKINDIVKPDVINDVEKYQDQNLNSYDKVDRSFLVGGMGKDAMVGALYDAGGGDNDGDNDYFFIDVVDVDKLHIKFSDNNYYNMSNSDNADVIINFYVASAFSDTSAEDYLIFSARQLGLDFSSIKENFDKIEIDAPNSSWAKGSDITAYELSENATVNGASNPEHFFRVSGIQNYDHNDGDLRDEDFSILKQTDYSDDLFSFILDTASGYLYFDKDGNKDYDDEMLVSLIGVHPNGGSISKLDANQILIVEDFSFA